MTPASDAVRRLLLWCAGVAESDPSQPGAPQLSPAHWRALIDIAQQHGMKALVYWRLGRGSGGPVPPGIAGELAGYFRANAERNLRFAAELGALTRALEAAGLASIAFKGPALAVCAYENLGLREFADLDILVGREHVRQAVDVLRATGYHPRDAAAAGVLLRGECELGLASGASGCNLDLHWRLRPKYFLGFDEPGVWERAVPVVVAGARLRTLASEDHLLVLALHNGRDCWPSLRQVSDVARLVRAAPIDWDRVSRLAARHKASRALRVALLLAAGLLQAPVPAEVAGTARRDPEAAALARIFAGRLFAGAAPHFGTPAEVRMNVRMLEGAGQKLAYLLHRALEPNQQDLGFVRLPPSLFPAYYVLRPLRLALKCVGYPPGVRQHLANS